MLHAGHLTHARERVAPERMNPRPAVAAASRIDRHHQQPVHLEAGIDRAQAAQALHEQARANQQHQRQRNLTRDDHLMHR